MPRPKQRYCIDCLSRLKPETKKCRVCGSYTFGTILPNVQRRYEIVKLIEKGYSITNIGKELGLDKSTIYVYLVTTPGFHDLWEEYNGVVVGREHARRRIKVKMCPQCGTGFLKRSIYCSKMCAKRSRRIRTITYNNDYYCKNEQKL